MQILSHEEVQRFLIQAREDDFFELALLEIATGMRRGEICGLKWEDLESRSGRLHIRRQASFAGGETRVGPLKTKASNRIVILPRAVVEVLLRRKKLSESSWMFPSPSDPEKPCDPRNIYRTMKKVLKRAQCRDVRFHDLRHTFATTALENGMDVKTLSAIIGHVSAATTIDVYSHITQPMLENAARKIDEGIGTVGSTEQACGTSCASGTADTAPPEQKRFEPHRGKIRKPGTGGVYRINDHLYEGRYGPKNAQGKREIHTVYAKTEEECEAKLVVMIPEVKARIKAEKMELQ